MTPNSPFLVPGTDFDQVAVALVQTLGLCRSPDTTFGPAKWVFCSQNTVGDAIYNLLYVLADAEILNQTENGFLLPEDYDPSSFGEKCSKVK